MLTKPVKYMRRLQLVHHNEEGFGYTEFGRELGEHLVNLNRWSNRWSKTL